MSDDAPVESSPLIAAAALVGMGIALRQLKPDLLDLPDGDTSRPHLDRGMSRKVRKTRDGIARILPSNLVHSLGNSLMLLGGGIALLRLLDEAVDDQERLF